MAEPKGDHLFVNVGASQARRRLKKFGHGVKKITTAGRNQALIIHTATGRHLEELEAKFADVGYSRSESELSEPIENLRNLGIISGGWLREIGIHSIDDLRQVGPTVAYRMVKQHKPQASLNLLWSLAAGLKDLDWRELTDHERQTLQEEVEAE